MGTIGLLAEGRRRGFAGAMLAFLLLAWQLPIQAQTRQPSEANVQLSWQEGWTPTGIAVEPGDTLSIRVRTIKGAAAEPQGECAGRVATHCEPVQRQQGPLAGALLDLAARQAIVGRLGEGKPFMVGHKFKKVMKAGGALSLRWNVPREAARAAKGFNVVVRVDPGPGEGEGEGPGGGDGILTNSGGGGPSGNLTDTNLGSPTNNVVEVGNDGTGAEPTNDQGNVTEPEENIAAAEPVPPAPPEDGAAVDPTRNVSAADSETRLSAAQLAVLAAALAAVLLALVAAAVGIQRWRRRRLVDRTRARLSVSPSLDLAEGACRGGGRPAEGPAASLRARLEEGAVHMRGGGKDG